MKLLRGAILQLNAKLRPLLFLKYNKKKNQSYHKCMEGKKEAEVLRECLDFLKFNGVFCWRQNTGAFRTERGQYFKSGLPGTPDILGVLPDGRFLGVECKREKGGRVSPAQQYVIKELLDSHAAVFVVHSAQELEQKLRLFMKHTKPLEDVTNGQ